MSSHHVVREKQEPALLIVNFDGFDEENLGQLLEWSPTVMVAANMYEHIASLGIKIDLVIEKENHHIDYQEHIKILSSGDDTIETALKYLVAETYPAVNVITDHFTSKDFLFFADLIDLVIFTPQQKIYPVKSGFTKWKPALESFYLPVSQSTPIETVGLSRINDHQFQTIKDGFAGFTFKQPYLFIAEDL